MSRPETTKLDLSDGAWVLFKKRLTAGEQRHALARSIKRMVAGEPTELDPEMMGIATLAEYLLDWNVKDPEDKPVVIRDQPIEIVLGALNALDADSYAELQAALDAHVKGQVAELEEQKKVSTGVPAPPATSASVG